MTQFPYKHNMGECGYLLRISEGFKDNLKRRATASGFKSLNAFLVCALTNMKEPDGSYRQSIKELGKVNQDLARLGNLFAQALGQKEFTGNKDAVEKMLCDIREMQAEVKQAVLKLPR